MTKPYRKLYQKPSWHQRYMQIIEADGNKCCECGRTPPDVVLQVHHLRYKIGKKPWEYNRDDLITLCKGCHARKHHLLDDRPPQSGWIYQGSDDLGDLCGVCEWCGTELRYEHYIYHPNYGYLSVGCECADRLTQTETASKNDHKMHLAEQRLQRYLNSPKWKKRKNCYFYPNLEGYEIMIAEKEYGYFITLIYNYNYEYNMHEAREHSKKKYETLDDAKKQIYHAITKGNMRRYLLNHNKPLPGSGYDYLDSSNE